MTMLVLQKKQGLILGNLSKTILNPSDPTFVGAGDQYGRKSRMNSTYTVVGQPLSGAGYVDVYDTSTGALLRTISDPDPSSNRQFGAAIDVDGTTLVVGSTKYQNSRGYAFDMTDGSLISTFVPPSGEYSAGSSIAVNGDRVILGDYQYQWSSQQQAGRAHFYNINGTLLANVQGSITTPEWQDHFGFSVAIGDTYAIIGQPNETIIGSDRDIDSGRVYIYNRDGIYQRNIPNPTPKHETYLDEIFGYCVDIAGTTAVIGCPKERDNGIAAGSVYIYNASNGSQIDQITPETADDSQFGYKVATDGTHIAATVQYGNDYNGEVRIYDMSGTKISSVLDPHPNVSVAVASAKSGFGWQLDVDAGTVLIADPYYDSNLGELNTGTVYLYNSSGSLLQTIDNPATDHAAGDDFGYSVAAFGTTVVIGARYEDTAKSIQHGKVYVYDANSGQLTTTIENPDAYPNVETDHDPDIYGVEEKFGQSVSTDGTYILVGTPQETHSTGEVDSGKAYLFDMGGNLVRTYNNPNTYNTPIQDQFGYTVATHSGYAAIYAYGEDSASGSSPGKVHLYNPSGSKIATISKPGGDVSNYRFGFSLAMNSTRLAIGTNSSDGTVYVFNLSGSLQATLTNPNPQTSSIYDSFGYAIDMSETHIIVGAVNEENDGGLTSSGRAYLFDLSGNLLTSYDNPNAYDTATYDNFGKQVSIYGNLVMIGAPGEDEATGLSSGKAYIFDLDGNLKVTLDNPNTYGDTVSDGFGNALALSNRYAIVTATAARDANSGTFTSGTVYVFDAAQ